ncbi:ubiquitin C-terminal hydrolase 12-like [Lactuca sativa]|uniref:ubiquitin C-terminal hydrolase 12-like n=1 Tax=Lactuca sativa TaxID=4236 RepID=UPI000CD9A761|nr:ubiquitin C-terminal hydrolase 12-like [Lactuca sativa]
MYVIYIDIHRKRARFDDNQNKWGFAKLIPLVHFKDISKGYLSTNDSCVFGVEVSTDPMYTIKDRCLSMIKPQETTNSYTWIIDNLSAVTEKCLHSEVFKVGKVKWTLSIYPKGISSGKGTNLSIFLEVHEAALASAETEHWFCESEVDWGFLQFMLLSELKDRTKGFLLKDRLIVEAKILVTGMIKDFI